MMTDDLISRQAALDALDEYFERIGKLKRSGLTKGEKAISLDAVGAIKTLPSAVVRCKDCKHWEYDVIFQDGWCRGKHQGNPDWFCADGERRDPDA